MKKGFTLVELLAVIVILAVIALIATPTILNMINKAKKGAFVDSSIYAIDAAYTYFTLHEEVDFVDVSDLDLNHKATITGYIQKKDDVTAVISSEQFCFIGTNETYELYENSCEEKNIYTGTKLANKSYTSLENTSEKIKYAGHDWYVYKDNGDSVTLIMYAVVEKLNRYTNLKQDIFGSNYQTVTPCLMEKSEKYCYYVSENDYVAYNWNNSIQREILYNWLENNAILNKAKEEGNLIKQNFTFKEQTLNDYIRIPLRDELAELKEGSTSSYICTNKACSSTNHFWFLSSHLATWDKNKFYFWAGPGINTHYLPAKWGLRPVITVKKAS